MTLQLNTGHVYPRDSVATLEEARSLRHINDGKGNDFEKLADLVEVDPREYFKESR